MAIRVGLGLVCALALARCASATAFRVERSDVIGPCRTAVPDRDILLGVALSGGGSRAALFGAAGLEALAGLRTADGASVIEKIAHVSSISGGSIAATYYTLKKPGHDVKVLNDDGSTRRSRLIRWPRFSGSVSMDRLAFKISAHGRRPATAPGSSSTRRSTTTAAGSR